MRNLGTLWDQFWFRPEPAINLRAAQVLLAANALWLALSRPDLPAIVKWPRPFWLHADPFLRTRFLMPPIGYAAEMTLYVVMIAALVLVIAGYVVRPAAIAAGLVLYHFAPFEDIFTAVGGPNFRGFTVPLLGLLIAGFAQRPSRADSPSPEYRWPLALVQILLAFTYLLSGVSKLRLVGPRWATASNFEGLILGMVFPDVVAPWASWFIGHPVLCWLGGMTGMAMDLGFIAAVFSRRAARVIVPLTFIAHVMIANAMNVVFLGTPLLLLFVNWDWVAARWRMRSGGRTGISEKARG